MINEIKANYLSKKYFTEQNYDKMFNLLDYCIIDVRSPIEFQKGHIPSAINIPLFTDFEREKIGKLYKNNGQEIAFKKGVEFAQKKFNDFIFTANKKAEGRKLLVYCWRGGMRSYAFSNLLALNGMIVHRLVGGYKAFRKQNRAIFAQRAKIIILSGMTGSGKTEILKSLAHKNHQVLDLEGLACHKGSAFGHMGEKVQPSNEHFENILAMKWRTFDNKKTIWVEDEAHSIGKVRIPDALFLQMRQAPVIRIAVSLENRIARLENDYTNFPRKLLIENIQKLRKRLGNVRTENSISAIEKSDFATAIKNILDYYDKTYEYGIAKRKIESVFLLNVKNDDVYTISEKLILFLQKKSLEINSFASFKKS